MDNCTQTRCFSILNKREKSIKYIIDDWLNVNKFRNKIRDEEFETESKLQSNLDGFGLKLIKTGTN